MYHSGDALVTSTGVVGMMDWAARLGPACYVAGVDQAAPGHCGVLQLWLN